MELHYYDSLPSTMDVAREAAQAGAKHLYTVIAKTQSAGRGRLDRQFFSPVGGLYVTTVLRTGLSPTEYGAVTPCAAVCVMRAIKAVCGVSPRIKWVNDLLLDGKKICGILTQSGVDQSGVPYLLLGIGINLGGIAFPPELCEIAGAVPCTDKEKLLGGILRELSSLESDVRSASWLADYKHACAVLSREVKLIENERQKKVFVLDILPNGALFVQNEDGKREEISSGEITLRLTRSEQK